VAYRMAAGATAVTLSDFKVISATCLLNSSTSENVAYIGICFRRAENHSRYRLNYRQDGRSAYTPNI